MKKVILVDSQDNPLGKEEKIAAHKAGELHRAFSVLIFNSEGDWLLQRRALSKYHSPGLWTNACCSHPAPGEKTDDAAKRRLEQELGISCPIKESFTFIYKKKFDNGLTEHEYDHVFIGFSDQKPEPDPKEVMDYRYLAEDILLNEVRDNPKKFTYWFRQLVSEHLEKIRDAVESH
ncbi:isopentenyl-diphosphate Delta-isomerase [Candidatus Woesearchaeota archaeon]|nr:isopentenyl-diphosphate Delta-isomerase [Candidatus Woesearchaeota archaeon]